MTRYLRRLILLTLVVLSFLLVSQYDSLQLKLPISPRFPKHANATLGFGCIYVVSKPGSERLEGLISAANVTEIDLSIPKQPPWTEEDEKRFRRKVNSTIPRGSLLAWFGHLHVLDQFLASGYETALILEDDVDWDIRLRTRQIPLVQKAIQDLVDADRVGVDLYRYPFGNPKDWDLLYLGHCGDYWHSIDTGFDNGHVTAEELLRIPHRAIQDNSLPDFANLHPWTTSLLTNLGVSQYTRLIHQSRFPLCTFGYGVTRRSANWITSALSKSELDGINAYDVAILNGCILDGLRCWSVNPELFHHVPGNSLIGSVDSHQNLQPVDVSGMEQIRRRQETINIACGFWSGAFRVSQEDEARLEYLRREVGRKGRCLKQDGL